MNLETTLFFAASFGDILEPDVLVFLVPIVAIVMGIAIGALAIFLNYHRKKEMFALYHQERMAAIDKGVELPALPDALFYGDDKSPVAHNPRRQLLKGLVWLFVGLGALIALYATRNDRYLFSLIPIGVGLAYLIYYFVAGKKEAEALEAAQKTAAAAPLQSQRV